MTEPYDTGREEDNGQEDKGPDPDDLDRVDSDN